MDIFRDDLFKNKYFLIICGVIAVIIGIVYLANYSSLENRCRRSISNLGGYFGTSNKLQQTALNQAMEMQIQACIKQGSR